MTLINIGIFIGIALIIGLIIWGARKIKLTTNDLYNVTLVTSLAKYLLKQYAGFKYADEIDDIIDYVIEAITIVKSTENITDKGELKDYIIAEAEKICEEEGITVDDEFVNILDLIVDKLIED